jgi:lipid II:glycine glycyltransferase (peptidoglycan interpeptide bridge formation enzyme)
MITVSVCEQKEEWDDYVLEAGGHPLQLWEWGEVKAAHGWRAVRVFVRKNEEVIGAAQLLIKKLPKPFSSLVYVPRGPVCENANREDVLEEIALYAKSEIGAVAITVEPDWDGMPKVSGWQKSSNNILLARTLILDLQKSEEELQADMTKKTRQYIRKSGGEALEIRKVKREEIGACLEIYKDTAKRAGFSLHGDQYYYDIFDMLGDFSPVYAAFLAEKPIAFLWLAISEKTAFELYGGMNEEGQQLRANYALKWHAITMMKKWELERYDMNGLLNDGVSTFKQGFASQEDMLAGTYDKPLSPLYMLWSKGLPTAKKIVRKLKSLR